MSKLTKNGVSTTTGKDTFRYEVYTNPHSQRTRVQWDYRDAKGKLYSGIAADLETAMERAARFGYVAGVSR